MMMPRVPSEPTNTWLRSGPTAARAFPPVWICVPSARRHVEADDHVLDLAVPGRELTGAAAREPATDGRQVDRLGPVADGHAVLGAQGVLEPGAERPGAHVDDERRVVDVDDAGEAAEVEEHAAVERDARAAHAAPAGGRR